MTEQPLRVLIVDDSRIFRSEIEDALLQRTDVKIVGSVWSGEKALEFARSSLPDFVTLDIQMPGMGGLATLKTLRELARSQNRNIGVLLVSSFTSRGAAVTMEGLQEGAFDFIQKPESSDSAANTDLLREQLYEKIDLFRARRFLPTSPVLLTSRPLNIQRRPSRFRVVVIGSSTGGPEALARLAPDVVPHCPVPILLVQHLPVDFAEYFATSLSRRCGVRVIEAKEGVVAEPKTLYVAQGGKHLILNTNNGQVALGYSDSPAENGCRPAADVMFRSAAAVYGGDVLAVVLTGMGSDGARGAAVLRRAGAHVIAQDEATSVVWGMPGSVVAAGAASEILPLTLIAPAIKALLGMGN